MQALIHCLDARSTWNIYQQGWGCSAINNFKRGHFGGGVNKGVVIKFCLWNPLKPLLGLVTSKAL